MSGRPYTISELKTIVDYLVENKLYSETRARKMWVDFANTKITNRTWQSLKETFLKRILPDIHNPYFKLTNEQISSFRARCDLADKDKNKLEIHTISDDSSSNGHNPKDNEPSNDEGETNAGENTKCSKITLRNRSSADTVILEHCYETVEDIRKDLESTDDKMQDIPLSNKSLRDCITYSEPLTPILQEVLDDFASEPEDSDRMEIVESESVPEAVNVEDIEIINEQVLDFDNDNATTKSVEAEGTENDNEAETVEELLNQEVDSEGSPENRPVNINSNTADESDPDSPDLALDEEISSMQAEIHTDKNVDDSELIDKVSVDKEAVVQVDASDAADAGTKNSQSEPKVQSGAMNHSNSTVDASLPNNQEAIKNKQTKNVEVNNKKTQESTNEVSNVTDKTQNAVKATRKRTVSEDQSNYTHKKKKRLHIELKSSSEADENPPESNKNVTEADKVPKVNGDAVKPQAVKQGRPKNTDDYSKPSTSAATRNENVIGIEDATTELPPVVINPCLQTVSLFDEQFNKTRHMSESSDSEKEVEAEKSKPEQTVAKVSKEAQKSRSESDTEATPSPPKKKKRVGVISSKTERDKAIANMFGVTSGGGTHSKRKRRVSHRARTTSHNTSHQNDARSNSSDWTSESESEGYVSPPRGRKNRPTKKYLKPRSAKISSLEEEGGLFVMYGKRIYPVVKDGKIIKNYVTFLPESDSDEELFWKQKYVEEKKKAAELKKLLDEAKEPKGIENTVVQQPKPISTPRTSLVQVAEPTNGVAKEVPSPQIEEKKEAPVMGPPEKIKIKFTKNNEEVHLEGHWPQIHPVLEQVVQIFHKESEPAVNEPPQKPAATNGTGKELSSGLSTPIVVTVDPEVHEKVNKIEKEIFQEIKERDQEEKVKPNEVNNVTKRKQPAQRKSSSSSMPTPEKQAKISNGTDKQTKQTVENGRPRRQKAKETENKSIDNKEISPRRQTPRKVLNETVNTNNQKTMQTRRSKQNLETGSPKEEEEEVKYMLATRSKRLSLKTANNKTNKKTYKSTENLPRIFSSPDELAPYSMDSTQGYQESDVSPAKPETRRKKKLDMSSFMIKTRNSLRRNTKTKSYPYSFCDAYNDSSNSSVDAPAKVSRENSSSNTEAYRSDSYQLLMPEVKIVLTRQLEPIHETSPNKTETHSKSSKKIRKENVSAPRSDNHTNNSGQITSDIGSSSNMSLPMSPELSIVENLSLSKEVLNSVEDYPTINEMQMADRNEPISCSNYRISEVDVTLPLMNQECDFESYNIASEPNSIGQGLVTESLLNKIDTFNINDQVTATDTLNKKLHDLLLESAKKTSRNQRIQNKDSVMDVDVTNAPSDNVPKKAKAKKRCSTPQKRKGSKKSAAPNVDPVVEEEHVESFSHGGGRQSCPPFFQAYLGNEVITEEINIANLTIANEKPKGRKKKDIIRVKIQRPKPKPVIEKVRSKSAKNASKLSIFTDSGINETESEVFQPVNESVELIHNHSETCLLTNECVGDSLEFVDNSKSVITLEDSLQSGDAWNSQTRNTNECTSPSPDLFCNNAQDGKFYKDAKTDMDSATETVYHSPYDTPNSLITEDISDDSPSVSRPTKWYLLSDDETNTNLVGQGSAMLNAGSYTSNLKHIFPVTCAVPDLSTITEMSDNSRKPALEDLAGLTGDDFNSLSVFDSNFNF